MASSKVMASRSPPNPDLPRQTPPSSLNLQSDRSKGLDSMNMEEILRNIYSDSDYFTTQDNNNAVQGGSIGGGGSSAAEVVTNKTAEEVWRDIVSNGGGGGVSNVPAMTLEDFLAKAGAVTEEEVRVPASVAIGQPAAMMNPAAGVPAVQFGQFGVDYGNGGMVPLNHPGGGGGSGRGKRKASAAEEVVPLLTDKATQQKQRRMIKNRESAARSRERKQAYTVELEAQVTKLEEENIRLLREEAELKKERYKQLMENLIPVEERRRPPKSLRTVLSAEW